MLVRKPAKTATKKVIKAGWQSGHAVDCNSTYAGSIPTPASISSLKQSITKPPAASFQSARKTCEFCRNNCDVTALTKYRAADSSTGSDGSSLNGAAFFIRQLFGGILEAFYPQTAAAITFAGRQTQGLFHQVGIAVVGIAATEHDAECR